MLQIPLPQTQRWTDNTDLRQTHPVPLLGTLTLVEPTPHAGLLPQVAGLALDGHGAIEDRQERLHPCSVLDADDLHVALLHALRYVSELLIGHRRPSVGRPAVRLPPVCQADVRHLLLLTIPQGENRIT